MRMECHPFYDGLPPFQREVMRLIWLNDYHQLHLPLYKRCLPLNCQVYNLWLSGSKTMKISNRLMDRLLIYRLLAIIYSQKNPMDWNTKLKKTFCNHISWVLVLHRWRLLRCSNIARSVMENCFVAKEVVMTPLPLKLPGYLRGRSLGLAQLDLHISSKKNLVLLFWGVDFLIFTVAPTSGYANLLSW